MAKLRETWTNRKRAKVLAEQNRPDLIKNAKMREKYKEDRDKEFSEKVKSSNNNVQAGLDSTKMSNDDKPADIIDILNEILSDRDLAQKIKDSNSPAILQMVLEWKYGSPENRGTQVIVEPIVYRIYQPVDNTNVIIDSSLGLKPSGLNKIPDIVEDLTTPTPPKSTQPQKSSMVSENNFGILADQLNLTPELDGEIQKEE